MTDVHSDWKKHDECWRRPHRRPRRTWFSHIGEGTDISPQTLWSLDIAKGHKVAQRQRPCDNDNDDDVYTIYSLCLSPRYNLLWPHVSIARLLQSAI